MKLAFPELTWLEPPSRGKLINELRHGGPVYEKPVSRPRSCRHVTRTTVGKRCATAQERSEKLPNTHEIKGAWIAPEREQIASVSALRREDASDCDDQGANTYLAGRVSWA